jgi:hypothetical protein
MVLRPQPGQLRTFKVVGPVYFPSLSKDTKFLRGKDREEFILI